MFAVGLLGKYKFSTKDEEFFKQTYDELKGCSIEELYKILILCNARPKSIPYLAGLFVIVLSFISGICSIMAVMLSLYKSSILIAGSVFLLMILLMTLATYMYIHYFRKNPLHRDFIRSEICMRLIKEAGNISGEKIKNKQG